MQRFKIIHRTYYNYSNSVDLGAHNLLLRPRENHELRIENFVLNITPKAKVLWHRDVEDNSVGIASFTESTQQLLIESESIIQQYNESPLDFLVSSYASVYLSNLSLFFKKIIIVPEIKIVTKKTFIIFLNLNKELL